MKAEVIKINILVACEESQRVCIEFRRLGHEAFSCDVIDCSGGHPEWHIKHDVLPLLHGCCSFTTVDGSKHTISGKWDMIIAHPPCTYLSNVATRHHSTKNNSIERINERTFKRIEAMQFFMNIANADCDRIAIENPVGVMNTAYRKPEQIIHPYYFANDEYDKENYVTKRTCLWLKGLLPLKYSKIPKPDNAALFGKKPSGKSKTWVDAYICDPKVRSKTFPGIAKAMAEQCGGDISAQK